MDFGQNLQQDILTLTPGRKFTASDGCEAVSRAVEAALAEGVRKVLFDLSAVEFLDSLGVGQIVASHVAVRNRGGELVLCRPSARVSLVLRMANLHMVLDIRDVAPEAVVWA